MDAAREVAQLAEAQLELVDQLSSCAAVSTCRARPCARGEAQREGDQPRLGAVVEVPLDAAALGVGGVHEAGARGVELDQPGAQLGLEPLVLQQQRGGGAGGAHRLPVLGPVVHDDGHALAVVADLRRGPAGIVLGGSSTGDPAASTWRPSSGIQNASSSAGSPSARARLSRRSPRSVSPSPAISTRTPREPERSARARPARNAKGVAATAANAIHSNAST